MTLINIPILQDNYVWLLTDNQHTIIVDPGLASPVIDYLQKNNLSPTAVLLTHHHNDHTDGVKGLLERYPRLGIYGPEETLVKGANKIVKEGDTLRFGNLNFDVVSTPGHTLNHVSYYCRPYLFSGDTLFSAGCGRIFEGTHEQMYYSLVKLAELPDDTQVCCAHEYTLSNLSFANALLPDDPIIKQSLDKVRRLRQNNQSTLPSLLSNERKINLFLRCSESSLKQQLLGNCNAINDIDLFRFLRNKKDHY